MKEVRRGKVSGMTLVEIMVALVVSSIVCIIAFTFYRNFMASLERQKKVTALQNELRNAVDCINRYLIAGGVSGDSLFFDPHKVLSAPIVNGGHRVFDLKPDSTSIIVYGNYSGSSGTLALPVIDKTIRSLKTHNINLFKPGSYAYIYAGSAQEVAKIISISDSTLTVANDFFAAYPKGTLIFPLERIRFLRSNNKTLTVSREGANGAAGFVREFALTHPMGDSVDFKVTAVDWKSGQISYALCFSAKTGAPSYTVLERKSEQTVFVRGFR
jgi:prepilin-type N-terminal cleavage/methylation domain-containing protein